MARWGPTSATPERPASRSLYRVGRLTAWRALAHAFNRRQGIAAKVSPAAGAVRSPGLLPTRSILRRRALPCQRPRWLTGPDCGLSSRHAAACAPMMISLSRQRRWASCSGPARGPRARREPPCCARRPRPAHCTRSRPIWRCIPWRMCPPGCTITPYGNTRWSSSRPATIVRPWPPPRWIRKWRRRQTWC